MEGDLPIRNRESLTAPRAAAADSISHLANKAERGRPEALPAPQKHACALPPLEKNTEEYVSLGCQSSTSLHRPRAAPLADLH